MADAKQWRTTLDSGSPVYVAAKEGSSILVLGIVRGKNFSGGGTWLQLALEDDTKASGTRRISLPVTSNRLHNVECKFDEESDISTRLGELAIREGLPLPGEPGTAEIEDVTTHDCEEVEVIINTISGNVFRTRIACDIAVSSLHDKVEVASGIPKGEFELVYQSEIIQTGQPFINANETQIALLLVRCMPIFNVILKPNNSSNWKDELAKGEGQQLRLEVVGGGGGFLPKSCSEHLAQSLTDQAVIGLSLRGWVLGSSNISPLLTAFGNCSLRTLNLSSCLPDGNLDLLQFALPSTLEDLDLSHNWPRSRFGMVSALSSTFVHTLRNILNELPDLQILRLRGLNAAAVEIDVRDSIRTALGPFCGVEF